MATEKFFWSQCILGKAPAQAAVPGHVADAGKI
jgi:hypothetical protein